MQKATSIARPNPACGCCEAPRSRRAPPPMWSLAYEDESEGQEQSEQPQRHACFITVIRAGYSSHSRCGIPSERSLFPPRGPVSTARAAVGRVTAWATSDDMINMTSRTDYIAISPSCIKFSVSFRRQFRRIATLLFFCILSSRPTWHDCKTPFAIVLSSVDDKMQKNISLFFAFCILSSRWIPVKLHVCIIAYLFFCILQLCNYANVRW